MLGLGLNIANTKFLAGDGSLADVVPSAVFDLDATKAASYPGTGQTWSNLVKAPADGLAQSAYDFYFGATSGSSTDDPTFTGTAGDKDAYFSMDGGDFFTLKSGTNTNFLKALHKTTGGTPWWWAMPVRLASAVSQTLFRTNNNSTTIGIGIAVSSIGEYQPFQRGDSATVVSNGPTLVTATDYLLICSYDGAGNRRLWANSRSKSQATWTFNSTSTDPVLLARIGATTANGTRIRGMAMGNAYIDDTEAGKIIDTYNSRYGQVFA